MREVAYLALNEALRGDLYLSDILSKRRGEFSDRDFRLVEELAYGTMRRLLTLDYFAEKLASKGKLSLKLKEKNLVRLAIYQYVFMDRIPTFAIGDEMLKVAKKYTHPRFQSFLNALIRRFDAFDFTPPERLDLKYSFPPFFIGLLKKHYDDVPAILEALNQRPRATMRLRKEDFKVVEADVERAKTDPDVYIQNRTPAHLMKKLSEGCIAPKRILDLCAAPGGKLIAAHDLYPEAQLFANDISERRLVTLKENLDKYGIEAKLSQTPPEGKFDLIILDVPCSNSGTFHKRVEARYRLTPRSLKELNQIQQMLLQQARERIAPGGQIWYMTCSILPEENQMIAKGETSQLILPNLEGWDGGYASPVLGASCG